MKDELTVPAEVRTKRLILRMPHPDDALEVCEAIVESLPELRAWLAWAHQEPIRNEDGPVALERRDRSFAFVVETLQVRQVSTN